MGSIVSSRGPRAAAAMSVMAQTDTETDALLASSELCGDRSRVCGDSGHEWFLSVYRHVRNSIYLTERILGTSRVVFASAAYAFDLCVSDLLPFKYRTELLGLMLSNQDADTCFGYRANITKFRSIATDPASGIVRIPCARSPDLARHYGRRCRRLWLRCLDVSDCFWTARPTCKAALRDWS
jgi:hypothetical protein